MTRPNPSNPRTDAASGRLAGLCVLITGGGTGIGRACALRLAADGAAVTICGRTEATLAKAADAIQGAAAHGGSVRTAVCDVTDESQVARTVAAAADKTGRLDACIANAGGAGGLGPYHTQDIAEFVRVLHLNVIGTLLCIKHTVPYMVEAGGGSFVGMSSIAGHQSHPYFGAYTAGKAGIEAMIRNAADEYGAARVRFNAIRPGLIATELTEAIPRDGATYASYMENTALADIGRPEDVAELARFLVGPESRWITGTCINVDGGHHLRRGPDFGPLLEPVFGANVLRGARTKS